MAAAAYISERGPSQPYLEMLPGTDPGPSAWKGVAQHSGQLSDHMEGWHMLPRTDRGQEVKPGGEKRMDMDTGWPGLQVQRRPGGSVSTI